jgi:hypothetical protein
MTSQTQGQSGQTLQASLIDPMYARMLFELHHRQLNETQQQIQSITEKAVGLVMLLTSWIVLSTGTPSVHLKATYATGIVVFASVACIFLATHAAGRRRIASVIDKLNEHFELFNEGKLLDGAVLYPPKWRGFGARSLIYMVGAHMAAVAIVSAVAMIAILIK